MREKNLVVVRVGWGYGYSVWNDLFEFFLGETSDSFWYRSITVRWRYSDRALQLHERCSFRHRSD